MYAKASSSKSSSAQAAKKIPASCPSGQVRVNGVCKKSTTTFVNNALNYLNNNPNKRIPPTYQQFVANGAIAKKGNTWVSSTSGLQSRGSSGCPSGQVKVNGVCKKSTTTFVNNALNYLNNNPNKRIPPTYQQFVANGQIAKKGNTWVSSTSGGSGCPSGQVRVNGVCKKSTTTFVNNALNYLNNNPNKRIPAAYQQFVANGAIAKKGNTWVAASSSGGGSNLRLPANQPGNLRPPANQPGDLRLPAKDGVFSANSNPQFCASTFGGGSHYKNVNKCDKSNVGQMAYVESALPFGQGQDGVDKLKALYDAAPDNAVKAAYFNMGSANDVMAGYSPGKIGTTNQPGCLYNSLGGCIKWGDSSSRATAVASAKRAIEQAVASGANTLRFDQLDVCQDGNGQTYSQNCKNGLATALTEISQAAKKAGINVVGNNGWDAQQVLIDAQNSGNGAKVVGAMLDDSFKNQGNNVQRMRNIVGSNVPIITASY
jgi:hypothetical protein